MYVCGDGAHSPTPLLPHPVLHCLMDVSWNVRQKLKSYCAAYPLAAAPGHGNANECEWGEMANGGRQGADCELRLRLG